MSRDFFHDHFNEFPGFLFNQKYLRPANKKKADHP